VANILYRNLGPTWFAIVWSVICLNSFSVVLTALQANSRTVFSFSRDGGLPDRELFSHLSAQKVPVYAVGSVIIVSILMGLLKFASTVALNAIFSLCTIALDSSYVIPIAMKLIFMNHPEVQFKPGPFSFGRGTVLMWFVNVISLAWLSFVAVILESREFVLLSLTVAFAFGVGMIEAQVVLKIVPSRAESAKSR